MSLTRGRIDRARPIMLSRLISEAVAHEIQKGRPGELAPYPVSLEPPYRCLRSPQGPPEQTPPWLQAPAPGEHERLRLRVWASPEDGVPWRRAEAFPRQLQGVAHPITFEVMGNDRRLAMYLSCHREDVNVLQTAFISTFDGSKLQVLVEDPLVAMPEEMWSEACSGELLAPSIYSKLFTQPDELSQTPLAAVLEAIGRVSAPAVGLYQVLFQPVSPAHNWQSNIACLQDYEFLHRYITEAFPFLRSFQQIPSGDEKALAAGLAAKAHNDKNLFAAVIRMAVIGEPRDAPGVLRTLQVFSGQVQQGGRPLRGALSNPFTGLSPQQVRDMFRLGLTYRPGLLANSAELTTLLHVPPPAVLERHIHLVAMAEKLVSLDSRLSHGSYIGDCLDAGRRHHIHIPLEDRPMSVHFVGKPGRGKSEVLLRIILDDIARGDGVAVLDPHGDLISDLLNLIPPAHADRAILLDWSDPGMIPLLNPLAHGDPARSGALADNIVSAMKDLSTGWGHRAEHILKETLLGLLHLPEVSFLDVSDAISPDNEVSAPIRREVAGAVDDPQLRRFWRTDLGKYSQTDRWPVQHKVGLLLDVPPVSRTFMQTRNALDLGKAMAEGKIILINLANLGADCQSTLGALLLSLLQVETLARNRDQAEDRTPFHIHIDEAHRFQTGAFSNLLVQCRKFGIGVCVCHQYLRQYEQAQIDALATANSTVIFNVNTDDARRLCNGLQERVTVTDIVRLKRFEAIARIDTEIVRVRTRKVDRGRHESCRDEIIARSHRQCYRPAVEVLRDINRRHRRWDQPFSPLTPEAAQPRETIQELHYDEF